MVGGRESEVLCGAPLLHRSHEYVKPPLGAVKADDLILIARVGHRFPDCFDSGLECEQARIEAS
ncbi:hypothetical protein D3C77_798280 [compost metagenome]